MQNIKIVYQYDGSCFFGLQRQLNKKTVQGTIENIIKKSFDMDINLISSGRTDRGVHARMQISNFYINKNISLDVIKYKIEKYSEMEIKIDSIEYVDLKYNARYDSTYRVYEYILTNKKYLTPFDRNYISCVDYDIDTEKLNNILKEFVGEHNFSSFSKSDKVDRNPIRTIYECYSEKRNDKIYIYIKGNSFLKTMVRIIVGTSLAIYEGKEKIEYIQKNFEIKDSVKKYIASEKGLYLYFVK